MCVSKAMFLLWMFSLLSRNGSSYNYEDYSEFSDNDITDGDQQQTTASPCPCEGGNRLRWEKIFIMMEDSHMMQKMLLQANEELKLEISSLRNHIEKISRNISASCLRVVEETCRSINVQQNIRVDQNMTGLKEEVQQREKMEELKSVEEKDKWWRWTKWGFWR